MTKALVHNIRGRTAVKIAARLEEGIRQGTSRAGDQLPPVRDLARQCGVSPATASAAYRLLRVRGFIVSDGRRGTRVSHRTVPIRRCQTVWPPGVRNLADGNPDVALLPDLRGAFSRIDASHHLYGGSPSHPELVRRVTSDLADSGVRVGQIVMVNGALDGIDRVLTDGVRPGDRVAVEDPSFVSILDLVAARGHSLVPVLVDEQGMIPHELERACRGGLAAMIVTPRSQNPTGAALTSERSRALRGILKRYPDILVIEADHAALTCDTELFPLHGDARRWVHVRSFSKGLSPDLRLAAVTGDFETVTRIQDRLVLGEQWVSHLLQRVALALLSDGQVTRRLRQAADTYATRRRALVQALENVGVSSASTTGYNVWVPVVEETPVVQGLLQLGWAVAAGERFRLRSPPAIRITSATLQPPEALSLARDLARVLAAGTQIPFA